MKRRKAGQKRVYIKRTGTTAAKKRVETRVDYYLKKEPFVNRKGIWFRKRLDFRGLRLHTNRGYVLSGLTNIPKKEAPAFKNHLLKVGDILDSYGISSIVPHRDTDPERFASVAAGKVYRIDDMKVSHSGIVVADLTYATTGGGIEMEIAKHAGAPIIVMMRRNSYASRMLLGHPSVIAIFEYGNYGEANRKLATVLESMFGKPSTLRRKTAVRQRERERKEGYWQ